MPKVRQDSADALDSSARRTLKPPRWEYVVLGLIILALIILGAFGFKVANEVKEPRRVSDRFVHSLLSNDTATAYELTAEPFRQANDQEAFKRVAEDFQKEIKTQPKIIDDQIERSKSNVLLATVTYSIPSTESNRLIVKLIKENDNWLVLTINNIQ